MRTTPTLAVVALSLVAALVSGCAFAVPGQAMAAAQVSAPVDPSFINGTDGGEDDQLAAATLRDLEAFWGAELPKVSGGEDFRPLKGYFSIDSAKGGQRVPCLQNPREIKGNAFYCPTADILGYDRAALLPALRQDFGDTAVVVVIAHEFGHALQTRVPGTPAGDPGSPTILSEGQADCLAGVFLRRTREGTTENVRSSATDVDRAMSALVTFRDPTGTGAADENAHGNAFDRVTSFQTGFDGGAGDCIEMSSQSRAFTQAEFSSLTDEANQGNLPFDELLGSIGPSLNTFFEGVVAERSGQWRELDARNPGNGLDVAGLRRAHDSLGDYASGTLVASRFGLAAAAATGTPTTGPEAGDAGRVAVCLAGAYTGSVGDAGGEFGLSPGDLDEAVQELLQSDRAAADAGGTPAPAMSTGYERVRVFRQGVDGGVNACLPAA